VIFFRSRSFSLTLKKGNRRLRIPIKVQVEYRTTIDPLSGMTVNLLDVDQWLVASLHQFPEAVNLVDWMKSLSDELRRLSSTFWALQVRVAETEIRLEKEKFHFKYFGSTWIQKQGVTEKVDIQLTSATPLQKMWIQKFFRRCWSSPEKLAQLSFENFSFVEKIQVRSLPRLGSTLDLSCCFTRP
jgi:hypothetical protein